MSVVQTRSSPRPLPLDGAAFTEVGPRDEFNQTNHCPWLRIVAGNEYFREHLRVISGSN